MTFFSRNFIFMALEVSQCGPYDRLRLSLGRKIDDLPSNNTIVGALDFSFSIRSIGLEPGDVLLVTPTD